MSDKLTRAITKDGFFKISAVVSTETAETARKYHNSSPVATAALGRLLSAGLLMGGELKEDKVTSLSRCCRRGVRFLPSGTDF
mgnify:CR=1 FL=1